MDGLLTAAPLSSALQDKFHDVTGLPHPRLTGCKAGTSEWDELVDAAEALFLSETTETWLTRLRKAGVPCAPYNFPNDVFRDPQIEANGFLVELEHPLLGRYVTSGPPIRMSLTPTRAQGPSPLLGADNDEILREIGLPAELIDQLRSSGLLSGKSC
jgi:crotonobetainyl-CoA:carnitine CoA-transferase CaiB-like acyl-CoA transferase